MLFNELFQLFHGVSGPIPHMTVFCTFAFILGWWTQEIRATLILMIIWSIFAECLQAYYPIHFSFQLQDIGWNILGSIIGLVIVQFLLWLSVGFAKKYGSWDMVREGQELNGNHT